MSIEAEIARNKEGGSAFPTMGYWPGMSLRDWFAGQALVGYLSAYADPTVSLPRSSDAAVAAYRFADAILAARRGEEKT